MLSERLGFDSLYAADHLFAFVALAYPFLDGWATLGGWAQLTTKTRLGVFVANLAWRDPVLMARRVIALDQSRAAVSISVLVLAASPIR